jgi:hypothetical protein
LLRINRHSVDLVSDIKKIMSEKPKEWLLAVKRGDQVLQVRVKG